METENKRGLSRDAIKLLAVFTMTLNHIANVFDFGVLSDVMIYIGYFTAVSMVYFLVEGYTYTRSRLSYSLRLFLFACLSQVPFSLAFSGYAWLEYGGLNMLFTLLLCFMLLLVHERVKRRLWRRTLYVLLTGLTWFCDWPLMAAIGTLLFLWAGRDRKRTLIAFALFSLSHFCYCMGIGLYAGNAAAYLLPALYGSIAPLVSGVVITFCYNGRRAKHGRTFLKWFFYAYYPAHLLLLGGIRLWVLGSRGLL